ncbi:hypothetical protein BDZ89DRAFT_1034241 [Hymenopellis radicata]|nr:hypothetical protein BDZ89DRAFT_1034241 [Hymenopellis radicata]
MPLPGLQLCLLFFLQLILFLRISVHKQGSHPTQTALPKYVSTWITVAVTSGIDHCMRPYSSFPVFTMLTPSNLTAARMREQSGHQRAEKKDARPFLQFYHINGDLTAHGYIVWPRAQTVIVIE